MENSPARTFSFVVKEKDRNERIDIFLNSQVEGLSRRRIQELIRNGDVKVNDRTVKASYRLKEMDGLFLSIPPPCTYFLEPEPLELHVVHEDTSLIVLYKPPGLVVHPAPGHPCGTLVHGLLSHCRDLSGVGGILRPGIVHRLDKDTSGLIVVAKHDKAHHFLSGQFREGMVTKIYRALIHGIPEEKGGEIDQPIGRHPKKRKEMAVLPSGGKRALTLWSKVEELGGRFAVLLVRPKTGRTHQIRVHLSHMGYPIIGDPVYGYQENWLRRHLPLAKEDLSLLNRQMLHAETLGFIHPDSRKYCEFHAPLPRDMEALLKMLKSLSLEDK